MQETLYQTADRRRMHSVRSLSIRQKLNIRQRMRETLYQTADAETLYQTVDAGDTLSDSGCISLSIRQRTLYQTADAETLYQTADAISEHAEVSLSDSGCLSEVSLVGCISLSIR